MSEHPADRWHRENPYEGEWVERYSEWFEETYGRPLYDNQSFSSIPKDYYEESKSFPDLIWRSDIYSENDSCELSLILLDIRNTVTTTECPPQELDYC